MSPPNIIDLTAHRRRRRLGLVALALAGAAMAFLMVRIIIDSWPARSTSAADASAPPISGQATVIDGDTMIVGGLTIRLWGIDAPELTQSCTDVNGATYACGIAARDALQRLLSDRPVSCSRRDLDRYGRTVATCSLAGNDIAERIVRAGHAVDYTRYSHGHYAEAENDARRARRGIWAGSSLTPEFYRHQRGRP